jgi:hypothetical protein
MDSLSILVIAFGAGCLTGLCFALWTRNRNSSARADANWQVKQKLVERHRVS